MTAARLMSRLISCLAGNRLAALEHRDERFDFLLPSGFGFHVVGPKRKREAVLRAEFRQHSLCLGLGIDRGLQIVGDFHVLAVIGARPAPVGLGRIGCF